MAGLSVPPQSGVVQAWVKSVWTAKVYTGKALPIKRLKFVFMTCVSGLLANKTYTHRMCIFSGSGVGHSRLRKITVASPVHRTLVASPEFVGFWLGNVGENPLHF